MRITMTALALTASTAAVLFLLATGGFLAGVEESGARGAGLLLVLLAILGFAATLFVVFRRRRRGVLDFLAAIVAIAPLLGLSGTALFFSGNPLGSPSPYLDWGAWGIGLLMALGALSIIGLALGRSASRSAREARSDSGVQGPDSVSDAQEEVHVTRVR